jgi:hypothetical protein
MTIVVDDDDHDDDVEEVPDNELQFETEQKQSQLQKIALVLRWAPAFLSIDPLVKRQGSG